MPIKRADIVVLLTFDEIERGIGCIAGALFNSTSFGLPDRSRERGRQMAGEAFER